jgi:paraquat-inducible protein B
MSEQDSDAKTVRDAPEPVVRTRRQFSIVWLVPIVAALIGAWLAYKAISERGPTVTITFSTAEGLEAGKTKIKYKDVNVGQVEAISLSEDLSHVITTAKLVKQAENFLSENTRFWVVRARVAAGEVSGLGTLFTGAYIGLDPGQPGEPARHFEGLDIPPIVTTDLPGRHFVLQAPRLASLDYGSPVYYRQIKAGKVVGYQLEEGGQAVNIKVFINAPHHEFVRKNTRFWNAGGLDVAVDATGIKVDTESFVTMMVGGIAFETPINLEPGEPAEEGDVFKLYENRKSIYEKTYARKRHYLLHFDGSVRGLSVGAPVEFRGIKVGEVTDIQLEFDAREMAFRIPVLIAIEPDRIVVTGEQPVSADRETVLNQLVEKGLRAQLGMGSLLTGKLYIVLDMHPEAPPRQIAWGGRYPELPTMPMPLEEITTSVTQVLNKIERMPIEQIGRDLGDTVEHLRLTVEHLNEATLQMQRLVENIDANITPIASATLEQTKKTLANVENLLSSDSPLSHDMRRALAELADAARSIRALADYLGRHPDALIHGKGRKQ